MTRRIRLSNTGRYALVDDDDYKNLKKFTWYETSSGYAMRASRSLKSQHIFMHRQIIKLEIPKGYEVDHRNGKIRDNQKMNLRVVTHADNLRNSKIRKDNLTGYKCVTYDPRRKTYYAYIHVNKRRQWFGPYKTARRAAIEYNKQSTLHFGDIPMQNKIRGK